MRTHRRLRAVHVVFVATVLGLAVPGIAGAGQPILSATDPISLSYAIPITNPATKITISDVLVVTSATLSSVKPDGSGIQAPKWSLFLSLDWISNPPPRPVSGIAQYFGQMNALPASAFVFTAANHKHYNAQQMNAWSPDGSTQSSEQDGLVDALNYFVVPISTRRGVVTIKPSRTVGYYYDFYPTNLLSLKIGGPINIPVAFPKQLTVTGGSKDPSQSNPSVSSDSSSLLIGLLVAGGAVGTAVFLLRRRPQMGAAEGRSVARGSGGFLTNGVLPDPPLPPLVDSVADVPVEESEATVDVEVVHPPSEEAPEAEVELLPRSVEGALITVFVLGALRFDPPVKGLSEPARAILCYLAFHKDRSMSAGEIQTALWPTSITTRDISSRTFRNYVTEARRVVGSDVLPEASRGAGYQIVGSATDFDLFQDLERQSRELEEPESLALRLQALRLVREYPFATETSTFFEWVRSEGLEGQVIRKVTELSYRTGLDFIRLDDLAMAEYALRVGLVVSSSALSIWEQLTDVVAGSGDGSLLGAHFTQAGTYLSASEVADLKLRLNHS